MGKKNITPTQAFNELPPSIKDIMRKNLLTPHPSEQLRILTLIRKLSMSEMQILYKLFIQEKMITPPLIPQKYIDGDKYEKMRKVRRSNYVKAINRLAKQYLDDLPKGGKFCDIGCGNGIVTILLLNDFLRRKGHIYACDILDYLHSSVKNNITFYHQDGLQYLRSIPDNYFDGIMETATLHHLTLTSIYRRYIKEMVRVLKPGSVIILLETTHTTWQELLRNAILDIVSNDTTSRILTHAKRRKIPVTIQFLSHKEILKELKRNLIGDIHYYSLRPNNSAPQFHKVYIGKKM